MMSSSRAGARVVATLALLGLWGCFGERRGLSRAALENSLREAAVAPSLPALEELVALRYPAPGSGGAMSAVSPCLVSAARRDFDEMLAACVAVIEDDPAAPRAFAAARVLLRAKSGFAAAGAVVAKRGAAWLTRCRQDRGACADLAQLVADERAARAAVVKDRTAFAAAVLASGRLTSAHVEGPYPGDVQRVFTIDANSQEPERHALAFRSQAQASEDGFFSPAASGVGGVYRLRFTVIAQGHATAYITSAHALRARVDGEVVAQRIPEERPGAVTRVALQLSGGPHTVELLARSLGRNDRISIALLNDRGEPAASPAGSARPGAAVKHGPPRGAIEALAVAPQLAGLEELLWRSAVVRAPSLGPDADEALRLGRALVSRFGASPVALATAAEMLGEEAGIPERVSSSAAAPLWSRVLDTWPDHPVARITAARNAREERPDEALAAYRALIAKTPRYSFGLREALGQLLEVGALDEARRAAQQLLALEQTAANVDAALPALRELGEHARAAELTLARASLDASFSPVRAVRFALDGMHTDEGLALLTQAAAREPWGSEASDAIDLLALTDVEGALRLAEAAHSYSPADAALAIRFVELSRVVRGEAAARAALLAALPLLRDSERATRAAERMGLAVPWAEREQLAAEVLKRRRAAPAQFAAHAAVALLDDVERYYHEDESSLMIRHLIVELASKEALDHFGELELDGARAIRARVHKPDGSFAEAERHAGVEDLSLPALAIGDVVELLTVSRSEPAEFGATFETRALDGTSTPALLRRYLLSFPEGFDEARQLRVIADNGLPAPLREQLIDGEGRARTRLTFALADVPAQPTEPFGPDLGETAQTGGFAWGVDEELWVVLRGLAIERAARPDAWLEEAARRIAGSGEPTERLSRVFAFVARKIEPAAGPSDAVGALLLGQGQRTPLLLALLRAAGLDATPVALQLTSQLDPSVPDGKAWSILGVRVRINARDHYALVEGNAVLDRLPLAARGAQVLDVGARAVGARRAQLPDSALDSEVLKLQASLAAEAAPSGAVLTGVVVITLPAASAEGARRALRRATPEQARALVESTLSPSFPGVEVADVRLPTLDAAGEALRIGARMTVPLSLADDGAVRFEHLFAQGVAGALHTAPAPAAYLSVAERRRPLVVLEDAELLEVEVTLPKGALFVEAPPHRSEQAGPFSLEQRVEITDGRLSWRRELKRAGARVPPAEWSQVASALAGMAGHLDARLTFVMLAARPAPG